MTSKTIRRKPDKLKQWLGEHQNANGPTKNPERYETLTAAEIWADIHDAITQILQTAYPQHRAKNARTQKNP